MAKRRGNPNWCSPQPFASLAVPSAFEQAVRMFKLSPEEYVHSSALKDWVRANKHNKFVPERLLQAWGFDDSREAGHFAASHSDFGRPMWKIDKSDVSPKRSPSL